MRTSEWWKTQALADEAGVDRQVANIKKRLRDREWVAEGDAGFRLTNPQRLLTEWARITPTARIPWELLLDEGNGRS